MFPSTIFITFITCSSLCCISCLMATIATKEAQWHFTHLYLILFFFLFSIFLKSLLPKPLILAGDRCLSKKMETNLELSQFPLFYLWIESKYIFISSLVLFFFTKVRNSPACNSTSHVALLRSRLPTIPQVHLILKIKP